MGWFSSVFSETNNTTQKEECKNTLEYKKRKAEIKKFQLNISTNKNIKLSKTLSQVTNGKHEITQLDTIEDVKNHFK